MESQIGLSFVGLASNGLVPLISTHLSFLESQNEVESFLLQFSIPIGMMLGQGDNYFTHKIYGNFPVGKNSNWTAYAYSFFILDEIIKAPRGHQNMYTFAILFIPKNYEEFEKNALEILFNDFTANLSHIDDLLQHEKINEFVKVLSEFFQEKSTKIPSIKPITHNTIKSKMSKEPSIASSEDMSEIPNKIALPLLLHSVFHGYETSTMQILGNFETTVDRNSELATLEILENFKFFDKIDSPVDNIQQSLDLACKHLSEIGEKVKINPISENKLEIDITCQLAGDVHPFLDVDKCLWIRYINSIIRRNLPTDKEIIIHTSKYDTAGSKTIVEFIPKRIYKELTNGQKKSEAIKK
jgi:DNA-directed RNA polymerase subunit F